LKRLTLTHKLQNLKNI